MAAVNVTSMGGKCINGSPSTSQLVYGNYIISTSPTDTAPVGQPAPRLGVWNRVTDTYKTYTLPNLSGTIRCVQPVEMNGDLWIVWWPASGGDSTQAIRIDPATAEVLQTTTVYGAYHPIVSYNNSFRPPWEFGGRRWALKGRNLEGPCGWTYGTTAVRIAPPIGGTASAYFHDNGDLWTYHGSYNWSYGVARYNLDTLSVVDSWPDPFGVLRETISQFVIIDGIFCAPISGSERGGFIKWEPGSVARLVPDINGPLARPMTIGPDNQLIQPNKYHTAIINPFNGAHDSYSPHVGMPAGRQLSPIGATSLVVDGTPWYPLEAT